MEWTLRGFKFYIRHTKDTENYSFLKMWTHTWRKLHIVILGNHSYSSENIEKEF